MAPSMAPYDMVAVSVPAQWTRPSRDAVARWRTGPRESSPDPASCCASRALADQQMIAGDVRLVGRDANLAGKGKRRRVAVGQKGTAPVDGSTCGQIGGPDAAADASARFEHYHRPAGVGQTSRRRQPGVAGADDANSRIHSFSHGW